MDVRGLAARDRRDLFDCIGAVRAVPNERFSSV
jgi:hypothetical protein